MTSTRSTSFQPNGLDRIEAAKNGVESAWAEIYSELAGPVVGYLRSRGAQDAEDLSSEVFYQVARDIHRFDGDEARFRSWVFVIAHRRLIDQRRARGRRPETAGEPVEDVDAPIGNLEDEVMEHVGTQQVWNVFRALTVDQQQVLALRIVADLTLEETATVMGKRVGAIKALQHRALASVRTMIEEGRVSL